MERVDLINLTADIVSSHVASNSVSLSDVPTLIQSVHAALSGLGKVIQPDQDQRQPVISVRASVKPDSLTCLVCGKKHKALKRHLSTRHDMTPAEYREAFGLASDYPMVAPLYAKLRSEMAKKIGLGKKRRPS